MISDEQLAVQERRVVSAARTGVLVDLSVGDDEYDDPANGAAWDGIRTVRAALLIELLTGERAPGRPRAIKIQGARIIGPLDLEALDLACPLLLRGCSIDEPVKLDEVTAPAIRLPGCHLPGLSRCGSSATWNSTLASPRAVQSTCSVPTSAGCSTSAGHS